MAKLLIIGIDPGTTLGYAVLDLNGNLIGLNSSKELNLDLLIKSIYRFGKPILIGCDKHKIPGFVLKFGENVRGVVDWPKHDLTKEEKDKLAEAYNHKNRHEKDALASALFAYNNVKELFSRIDGFLEKQNKAEYKDKVKEIMVKNPELNIPAALHRLIPKEKIFKKEKRIIENKSESGDCAQLKNEIKRIALENKLIKKQNRNLKNKIRKFKTKIIKLREQRIIILDDKIKEKINLKDMNLATQYKMGEKRQEEITELNREIILLNNFLSRLNDHVLVKKLNDLGLEEYNYKNKILNIVEDDVLLVRDCDIFSEKVLEILKRNLNIIIYKNKISNRVKSILDCISAKDFRINESAYFAIIKGKDFEEQLKKRDLLGKIVEEYRAEKKH